MSSLRNRTASPILAACLTLAAVQAGQQESQHWKLSAGLLDQQREVQIPAQILEGPFVLDAQFVLSQLEGTAASIRFGDQLNFGFDGSQRTLFAEGRAIGKVQLLEPSAKHIKPGVPFDFRAERTTTHSFSISINGQEVFQLPSFPGPLDTLAIRPMRNRLDLRAIEITGSLNLPEPGLHPRQTVIPILTDGEPHTVLELEVVLEAPRTLKQVALEVDGAGLLDSLKLTHHGETVMSADSPGPQAHLKGNVPLSTGVHTFEVQVSMKKETDSLKAFRVSSSSATFADGGVLKPRLPELPDLRPAYPIHKQGEFDCHTFRIPAIAKAKDGSLLAVYDMRYNSRRDLQEHMDIGLSRSTDGGITWADPVPIMDMGEWGGKPEKENGCSDPGILVDETTGEIFVTAVWTHGKPGTHQWVGNGSEPGHGVHRSSQFMVVKSTDHGETWSTPENLTKELKDPSWHLFAPAPGNGITMQDGTLVMPTQGRDATGRPFSNIMWSRDHGKTWTTSEHARDNTTECAVAELSTGALLLNMRDNRNRSDKSDANGRSMATTMDFGKTWSIHPADHGALPEPVCMASMIAHELVDGRHVLIFSNPNHRHSRKDMTIQLSFDDGKTWPAEHHLLLDSKGGSYSSLVMIDEGTLGILYESSQADLVFQRIPISDLLH